MTDKILTQSILKELLHYDSLTGDFVWKYRDMKWFKTLHSCSTWNTRFAKKQAGCIDVKGYVVIGINSVRHKAHRLAILYMTGKFPMDQTDHVNHLKADNRWCNLREVTNKENHMNRSLLNTNTSGFNGVRWRKTENKWRATISTNGKPINLGAFTEKFDAIAARKAANIKYGFHENHGSI